MEKEGGLFPLIEILNPGKTARVKNRWPYAFNAFSKVANSVTS